MGRSTRSAWACTAWSALTRALSSWRRMMFEHSNGISAGAKRAAPASRSAAHLPASPESSSALTTAEASQTRRPFTADRRLLPQELPRHRCVPLLWSPVLAPEPTPHRRSACSPPPPIVHADTPATTFPRAPLVPPARRGHRRECLERLQPPCSDNSINAAELQISLLPRGGCARRVRTKNQPWPHSTATTGGRAGEPSAPSARVRAGTAARPSPATAHSLPADPAASALAPVAVVGPPRRPNGTAAELAADVHWRGPRARGCRLAKRRLGDV